MLTRCTRISCCVKLCTSNGPPPFTSPKSYDPVNSTSKCKSIESLVEESVCPSESAGSKITPPAIWSLGGFLYFPHRRTFADSYGNKLIQRHIFNADDRSSWRNMFKIIIINTLPCLRLESGRLWNSAWQKKMLSETRDEMVKYWWWSSSWFVAIKAKVLADIKHSRGCAKEMINSNCSVNCWFLMAIPSSLASSFVNCN